jgi:hypothetical protein
MLARVGSHPASYLHVDLERGQSTDGRDALQRVEEEPLMFQRAPPRVDHGVRELQFRQGQHPAPHARGDECVDLAFHVLDAAVWQDDWSGV